MALASCAWCGEPIPDATGVLIERLIDPREPPVWVHEQCQEPWARHVIELEPGGEVRMYRDGDGGPLSPQ